MAGEEKDRERVFIGLGSNVGDRRAMLDGALDAISALPGVSLVAVSAIRETAPVGPIEQGPYLNAVAELAIDTARCIEPESLLHALLEIERALGRDRSREARWGPRTLDLDVLLYGQRQVRTFDLEVPHPRLSERRFVLEPLAELAPDLVVPGVGTSVSELLAAVVLEEDES